MIIVLLRVLKMFLDPIRADTSCRAISRILTICLLMICFGSTSDCSYSEASSECKSLYSRFRLTHAGFEWSWCYLKPLKQMLVVGSGQGGFGTVYSFAAFWSFIDTLLTLFGNNSERRWFEKKYLVYPIPQSDAQSGEAAPEEFWPEIPENVAFNG